MGILARRLEPGMLVRGMIDDEIDQHADAALLGAVGELDEIADGVPTRTKLRPSRLISPYWPCRMCQNKTDSQKPLSGAWAKVQGHATAQLQLSNQSPVMCQPGSSAMTISPQWIAHASVLIAGADRCRDAARHPTMQRSERLWKTVGTVRQRKPA